jgi:hypothetical protein
MEKTPDPIADSLKELCGARGFSGVDRMLQMPLMRFCDSDGMKHD